MKYYLEYTFCSEHITDSKIKLTILDKTSCYWNRLQTEETYLPNRECPFQKKFRETVYRNYVFHKVLATVFALNA